MQRERITLVQDSLIYRDARLNGCDAAAVVVEVIEHLDANRLAAFARALFEFAQPQTADTERRGRHKEGAASGAPTMISS